MRYRDHPIHPVLGIGPLALLAASVALDLGALVTRHTAWHDAGRWALGAGACAGVIVAVPGIVDAWRYPPAARTLPIRHGILNGAVIVVMACAWWLRAADAAKAAPSPLLLAMSGLAVALAAIALRIGRRLTR